MDSLQKLTSAQEYVNFYYEQLKNELNARGLQVSKVGLIGLTLHILGFNQQDIKQYFEYLFREAFVATADKSENLNMHGSVFGYIPGLATSASVTGYFDFNLNALPQASTGYTRTVMFENIQVMVDTMVFNLDAKYVITGNMCQITDSAGKVTNVPFSLSNPRLPIVDMNQYEKETHTFTSPYYVYGAYYQWVIELSNKTGSISDVKVWVQESSGSEKEEYEVRLIDYYTGSSEKVIFAKFLSGGRLLLELGSGIHGKYIPNASITVQIKNTFGSKGNISKQEMIPFSGSIRIFFTNNTTGVGSSQTLTLGSILKTSIEYADGGVDSLDGEDLRTDIINFIRSRGNLMSEQDFYDILSKYLPDFLLMFKKTHVVDNIIYCYVPFRDSYQLPIKSQSISVKHPVFNPSNACYVYRPVFTVNDENYISPFLFYVDYVMRYYKGYLVFEQMSTYFTTVADVSADSGLTNLSLKSLPLTLFVNYKSAVETTQFLIQSYESIRQYLFKINIPELGIYDMCLTPVTSTSCEYYFHSTETGSGLIFDEIDISIDVYYNGYKLFVYTLNNFKMAYDISDVLTLRTFEGFVTDQTLPEGTPDSSGQLDIQTMFSDDAYVLNIPVMKLATFQDNEDYYLQKFLDAFTLLSTDHPRMMSDDVQMRFINADYIEPTLVSASTKQAYNFKITFPLVLTINIAAYKEMIKSSNINTTEAETTLKLQLAQKLHDVYTGTSVSFYKTQIIDMIHDISWVKYCSVKVTDSLGQEIPGPDFELLDQRTIIGNLDKLNAVSYCPMYIWWDLDNIVINMTFE